MRTGNRTHAGNGLLAVPGETPRRLVGARDALTAIIAEAEGFDGLWLSSLELSASLGLPDLGLLSITEALTAAQQIKDATCLPLLVDCDTGFGGPINARRTARDFAVHGIDGICLEDKAFPKRNSFLEGPHGMLSASDFAESIRSAARGRGDHQTVLVARTECLIAGGPVAEAVERAEIYRAAGADAVLVHSKQPTSGQIVEFMRRWRDRGNVVVVPTSFSGWSLDEARSAGVSALVYANYALRASISATRSVFRQIICDGMAAGVDERVAKVRDIFDLTSTHDWDVYR
jgi:phosphoenolpyruvate phosphomutase